ncbi:phytoene desaturase family protein [Mucisphaera calidilacus]|uniref:All-trans-zeta-carotene desaturase n=1 Tax=Mucisphaera calidilacus TaxID=2527982 RepID=A0A518BUY7_9BACT|nr:phytoene desaturase family protein [Mucisphaera calidilacus]QDU70800.1 All-trans-zeta-carotene desaturase [Mucisphaera calidilacus]
MSAARAHRREKVIVIGAGPGGLATAMLLAAQGLQVKVVERRDTVGGRTSTFEHDGFSFDMGPTFFLYPQILREIFSTCGLRLEDEIDLIRLDPQYHLVFQQGGELLATPDTRRMQEAIAKISPEDARRFPDFMNDNREKFARFAPILQRPFSSILDCLSPEMINALPSLRPWASVDSDLGRHFDDERVRLAFSFQSKYLGMSPFNCPSLFTILSYLEYDYGVFHPRGGCGAVSRAMARAAERLGAEVQLDTPVEEILFDGRRAAGIRTAEGTEQADAVVINADFGDAITRLIPENKRRKYTDRKVARKRYSCSTFMMYLGIDGRYDDLEHHTIFLAEDYRKNLQQIERGFEVPTNPSVYVQNASVTDDSLAPAGQSTLYVLAPVAHQTEHIDWEQHTQPFRRRVLDQLAHFGLDDLESRIRYEKIMTPTHWQQDMRVYKGATFNLAHNLTQMLHLRPNNRFEEFDGVYLTGGGTHPGSGLPVIYESARISSRLLLEDMGIAVDWPAPSPTNDVEPLRMPELTAAG